MTLFNTIIYLFWLRIMFIIHSIIIPYCYCSLFIRMICWACGYRRCLPYWLIGIFPVIFVTPYDALFNLDVAVVILTHLPYICISYHWYCWYYTIYCRYCYLVNVDCCSDLYCSKFYCCWRGEHCYLFCSVTLCLIVMFNSVFWRTTR